MGTLERSLGRLSVWPAGRHGYATRAGLVLDVPMDPRGWVEEEFKDYPTPENDPVRMYRNHLAVFPELGCITPSYLQQASVWLTVESLLDSWQVSGTNWRTTYSTFRRTSLPCFEYYDAAADGTSWMRACTGPMPENWLMWLKRYVAPEGRTDPCHFTITQDVQLARGQDWIDGVLTLYFSTGNPDMQYPSFLHVMTLEEYNLRRMFNFLSVGTIVQYFNETVGWTAESEELLAVRLETFYDPEKFDGTHIIVECRGQHETTSRKDTLAQVKEGGARWHAYLPTIRPMKEADFNVYRVWVSGGSCTWHLTPMLYGSLHVNVPFTAEGAPVPGVDLDPVYLTSLEEAKLSGIVTEASGWTVSFENLATLNPMGLCPGVRITQEAGLSRAYTSRPVVWRGRVTLPATIAYDSTPEIVSTGYNLEYLRYEIAPDYRGSGGEAVFTIPTDLPRRFVTPFSEVGVSFGWDDAADANMRLQKVATAYIDVQTPVIERAEDFLGTPSPHIRFGDLAQVRLNTEAFLLGAADGVLLVEWAEGLLDHIGLSSTMIDVAEELQDFRIPLALPYPSQLQFPCETGTNLTQHLDLVCNALGFRWGCDKDGTGKLFIDTGPEVYVEGTSVIQFEIDYDESTMALVPLLLGHQLCTDGFYTDVLLERLPIATAWRESYVVQNQNAFLSRNLAVDHGRVLLAGDPAFPTQVQARRHKVVRSKYREFISSKEVQRIFQDLMTDQVHILRWESQLRPYIRPDHFIQLNSGPGIFADTPAVFRVGRHVLEKDSRDGKDEQSSSLTAVQVSPAMGYKGFTW